MMKTKKVIATVAIIIATLAITVVPCFAAVGGDYYTSTKYDINPFYVESITFTDQYEDSSTFVNNGVDYGSTCDVLAEGFIGRLTYDEINNGFSVFTDYGGNKPHTFRVVTNEFSIFCGTETSTSFPNLTIATDNMDFNVIRVYLVGEKKIYKGTEISSFSYSISDGFTYVDGEFDLSNVTQRFFSGGRLNLGDSVKARFIIDCAAYSDDNPNGVIVNTYCSPNFDKFQFINNLNTPVVVEGTPIDDFDFFGWFADGVDDFLGAELLPNVTFGTLLMMVIAIPALFAVLKMLGGGG